MSNAVGDGLVPASYLEHGAEASNEQGSGHYGAL